MSGLRIRDVPVSRLSKLAKGKMTAWEPRRFDTAGSQPPSLPDDELWVEVAFVNNRYSVLRSDIATDIGLIIHLWIRRLDGEIPSSWADLQAIKDQLIGEERVAVQVYPKASELVDSANMAHLWVYPEGYAMPFGLRRKP